MGTVKIKYYVVQNGRGYWFPTPRMKACGFNNIRCGPDGPAAWALAESWNQRWQAARRGVTGGPGDLALARERQWPEGSLGDVFRRFRVTDTWRRKPTRTQEDWNRGWRRIEKPLGGLRPVDIDFELADAWYGALLASTTVREAFGAMKTFRALWKIAGAMKLCDPAQDPSAKIRRQTPVRRKEIWTEGEAVRLVKGAWRAGYCGLACIVAVMWDTSFSPVDARKLTTVHRVDAGFFVERSKTGASALGTLSRRTQTLIEAYHAILTPAAGTELFRNRSGAAYSKDTLGDDFRDLRALVFGVAEGRKLADLRRSGSVEALAGDASMEAIAAKMGNDIDQNKELRKVYLPHAPAVVEMADAARLKGRARMRKERKGGKS
jgi:hypothetical protein